MNTENETPKRRKPRVRHIWLDDEHRTQPEIGGHSVFRAQPKKRRRRTRIRHIELPSGPRVEN